MNEYIAELSNLFSFDELARRSWLEIALIVSPAVALIFLLLGYLFFLKTKVWQWSIYSLSLVLLLGYLPYELMRQSTEMSRAQANVNALHDRLQTFLHEAHIEYVNSFNDEAVAVNLLDELIKELDINERKALMMISWLMSENEKHALGRIDDRQKLFADEIKTSVSTAKSEIIDSRKPVPVEKISGDVVKRLETEVNHLLENKMGAFKQQIDATLDSFENDINSFIQSELGSYGEKLTAITEQNADALRNYSNQANRVITQQVGKINQESLKKLDDTKASIEGIGTAIGNIDLQAVLKQVEQLSTKVERAQKRNDVQFEYLECMRTAGMLDLGGKRDECRGALDSALNSL
ncbi:MAG: hypothetical protein KIS65_00750 [Nitrosomonas sp.]|nr:hypothetical protein [Nitrosomonas sp.]MCW5617736.1 hypothetical protein [Nitrosomonas sp.]